MIRRRRLVAVPLAVNMPVSNAHTQLTAEWRRLTVRVTSAADMLHRLLVSIVKDWAIECLGVTEADIKQITNEHVVLWNRRRLPYSMVEVGAWIEGTVLA